MADRRTLTIEIVSDPRKGVQGLKAIADKADDVGSRFKSVGDRMADIGSKMTTRVTLPIVAGLGYATKAASDLGEAVNVTGLIFKDSREEIDAFVKTTAKGLGQSERAAREATATFGGLLQNLGFAQEESVKWSIDLTKLASDLGSAFNKDPAEAVQAIGSALRGETEPIRAYNVMLDDTTVRTKAVAMGLAATTAEVSKQDKAQASLALIMEQTKVVHGDFANTSGGLANQMRITKAELEDTAAKLGTDLLPIALDVVQALRGMVGVFTDLDPQMQKVVLSALGVAAAMGPLMTIGGNAVRAFGAVHDGTVALGNAFRGGRAYGLSFGTALKGLGIAAGVAAGVVVLVQGLKALNDRLEESSRGKQNIDRLTASLLDFVETGEASLPRLTREGRLSLDNLGKSFDNLAKRTTDWGQELTEVERRTIQSGARNLLRKELDDIDKSLAGIVESGNADDAAKAIELVAAGLDRTPKELLPFLDDYRKSLERTTTQNRLAEAAQDTQGKSLEDLGESVEEPKDAFDELSKAVDAFAKELDTTLGVQLDAEEAASNFRDRIDQLRESIKENGTQVGIASEKQRTLWGDLRDTVAAAEAESEAMARNGAFTEGSAQQKQYMIDRLNELKKTFPQLGPVIDTYIAKVAGIPDKKSTQIELQGAATAAEQLRKINTQIDDLRNAKLSVRVDNQVKGAPRASGGPVSAGALYRVGEQGEEWFVPEQDGTIVPNDVVRGARRPNGARAAAASAPPVVTTNINVHMPNYLGDKAEVVRTFTTLIEKQLTRRQLFGSTLFRSQ